MAPQQSYHQSIPGLPYGTEMAVINEEYKAIMEYVEFTHVNNEPSLWVFGYGSLVWLPKFKYSQRKVGYVSGYARRFWQGNSTHRGSPGSPGRVATLLKNDQAVTWGTAYMLRGAKEINDALKHLYCREVTLGGYDIKHMDFHFREEGVFSTGTIKAVTFVATPNSSQYLGPAPIETVAKTIVNSRGESGHNLEYLFRLTDSLREVAPETRDHHLENLEDACHVLLSLKLIRSPEDDQFVEDKYVLQCLKTRRSFISASLLKVLQQSPKDNKHFFNARSE